MKHLHTPGPWEFNEGMIEIEGDILKAIAMVRGWGWLQKLPNGYEIQCANGKLISAAPELLKALESMCGYFERNYSVPTNYQQYRMAKEAIKKATS